MIEALLSHTHPFAVYLGQRQKQTGFTLRANQTSTETADWLFNTGGGVSVSLWNQVTVKGTYTLSQF